MFNSRSMNAQRVPNARTVYSKDGSIDRSTSDIEEAIQIVRTVWVAREFMQRGRQFRHDTRRGRPDVDRVDRGFIKFAKFLHAQSARDATLRPIEGNCTNFLERLRARITMLYWDSQINKPVELSPAQLRFPPQH